MPPTIAVLGDALLDVTLTPRGPMRSGGDVPAEVRLAAGGQGANLAIRMARRGAAVRLACGLGDDVAGGIVRDSLEADGVSVVSTPLAATGAVAILIDEHGERTMLSQRAPFLGDVDVARLAADADWLVISGYLFLEDGASGLARTWEALPVRRAVVGCAVPPPRAEAWLDTVGQARPDLVIVNLDEARALSGRERPTLDLAATLASDLEAMVIITGPHDAHAVGPGLRVAVAADAELERPVDTTGAGDAFAATVLAALGPWPPGPFALRAALTEGLAVAREVVGVPGAQARVASEQRGSSA